MESLISKEELERIKNLKGEARGAGLKSTLEYVLHREGKEGMLKVEKAMADFGYSLKQNDIKAMSFYPLPLEAFILVAIKELFNYENKDFQEIGRFGAKSSLLIKMFMKYFVSFEKFIDKPPEMWKRYFTTGDLKVIEFNDKEKYVIARLENFIISLHHCQLISGFFSSLLEMMIKQKVSCKETKCLFKGDNFHEFLLTW